MQGHAALCSGCSERRKKRPETSRIWTLPNAISQGGKAARITWPARRLTGWRSVQLHEKMSQGRFRIFSRSGSRGNPLLSSCAAGGEPASLFRAEKEREERRKGMTYRSGKTYAEEAPMRKNIFQRMGKTTAVCITGKEAPACSLPRDAGFRACPRKRQNAAYGSHKKRAQARLAGNQCRYFSGKETIS